MRSARSPIRIGGDVGRVPEVANRFDFAVGDVEEDDVRGRGRTGSKRGERRAIWGLLTDAPQFPAWSSTVTKLKGPIALGNKLALDVKLDPKRTLRLR